MLNAAYASTGSPFFFTLASTSRTTNANSVRHDPRLASRDQRQERPAYRRPGHLEPVLANIGQNLLGWATFPQDHAANPKRDGYVVILNNTRSRAAAPCRTTQGDTTHEIGHRLGLYHTFQGGCTAKGDQVSGDTPAEKSAAFDRSRSAAIPARRTSPDSIRSRTFAGLHRRLVHEHVQWRPGVTAWTACTSSTAARCSRTGDDLAGPVVLSDSRQRRRFRPATRLRRPGCGARRRARQPFAAAESPAGRCRAPAPRGLRRAAVRRPPALQRGGVRSTHPIGRRARRACSAAACARSSPTAGPNDGTKALAQRRDADAARRRHASCRSCACTATAPTTAAGIARPTHRTSMVHAELARRHRGRARTAAWASSTCTTARTPTAPTARKLMQLAQETRPGRARARRRCRDRPC